MTRIIKKLSGLVFILMLITVWAIYSYNDTSILTSASSISNKKINWGIKRGKNHEQPDLGTTNIELIEKYDGIAMGNKEKKVCISYI